MKLIDKDTVTAEIEKRIKTNKECMLGLRNLDYYQGKVDALNDTISFLDTLEVKEETEWNEASIKPPFTSTFDGNKYSNAVLCKNKSGGYDIAQYVRLQTGYRGWFSGENEVTITHWKKLQ